MARAEREGTPRARRAAAAETFDAQRDDVDIRMEDIEIQTGEPRLRESAQRELAAAELDEQTPVEVGPGDVQRTGEGFGLRESVQREIAARDLDRETPIDVGPEDVERTDDGFGLHESVQREIAALDLDEQTPIDVGPEDVVRTDDGFGLSESVQREIAARDLDQETPIDVGPEDVERTDDGFGLRESVQMEHAAIEFQRELAAGDIDRRTPIEIGPEDVERTDEGFGLRESVQRELAALEIDETTPIEVGPGDLVETDDGFRLDEDTQRKLAARELDEQTPIDVGPGDVERADDDEFVLRESVQRETQTQQHLPPGFVGVPQVPERRQPPVAPPGFAGLEPVTRERTATQTPAIPPGFTGTPELAFAGPTVEEQKQQVSRAFQEDVDPQLERGEHFEIERHVAPAYFAPLREGIMGHRLDVPEPGTQILNVELTEEGQDLLAQADSGGRTERVISHVGTALDYTGTQVDIASRPLRRASTAVESRFVPDPLRDATISGVGRAYGGVQTVGGIAAARSEMIREPAEDFVVDPLATAAGTTTELAFNPLGSVHARRDARSVSDIVTPQTRVGQLSEDAVDVGGRTITTLTIGLGDTDTVAERSRVATDTVVEDVVDPVSTAFGRGVDFTQPGLVVPTTALASDQELFRDIEEVDPEAGFTEAQTRPGRRIQHFGETAGTSAAWVSVGLPATTIGIGGDVQRGVEFTGQAIAEEGVAEGVATSTAAGVGAGRSATAGLTRQAVRDPVGTAGALVGGAVVGTALSPLRVARYDVPLRTGETATVRGLRVTEPLALRGRVDIPGRTLAGTVDGRPQLGTPRVPPSRIDFDRFEGRGATVEPVGRFETDILRRVSRDVGGETARRFAAAEALVRRSRRMDADLDLRRTEDVVRQARDAPEGSAPQIADALRDLDATIFGSTAVRAQVAGARRPRDIDIMVHDKGRALRRLQEALEGTGARVREVFDIKHFEERAAPGEVMKFGRTARDRIELDDGVTITPAADELLKKAGASAFIRGPGSPAPQFPGLTRGIDVGPEPVRAGRFPRVKDPADASLIATEMAGPQGLSRISPVAQFRARRQRRDIREFRDAFQPELDRALPDQPPLSQPGRLRDAFGFDEFLAAERAQAGFAPGRRTRPDRGDPETDLHRPPPEPTEPATARPASPARTSRAGFDDPVPIVSPGVISTAGSSFASPAPAAEAPAPASPGAGPVTEATGPISPFHHLDDSPGARVPGPVLLSPLDIDDPPSPVGVPTTSPGGQPGPSPSGTPTSPVSTPGTQAPTTTPVHARPDFETEDELEIVTDFAEDVEGWRSPIADAEEILEFERGREVNF